MIEWAEKRFSFYEKLIILQQCLSASSQHFVVFICGRGLGVYGEGD